MASESAIQAGDRVLVIPLGVYGTVVRVREVGRTGPHVVVRADCATQDVAWKLSEVSKVAGQGIEHSIQDPETGEITARLIF